MSFGFSRLVPVPKLVFRNVTGKPNDGCLLSFTKKRRFSAIAICSSPKVKILFVGIPQKKKSPRAFFFLSNYSYEHFCLVLVISRAKSFCWWWVEELLECLEQSGLRLWRLISKYLLLKKGSLYPRFYVFFLFCNIYSIFFFFFNVLIRSSKFNPTILCLAG